MILLCGAKKCLKIAKRGIPWLTNETRANRGVSIGGKIFSC